MEFKFNVPNKITIIRISLIPLFAFILFKDMPYKDYLAAFVFGMLSISDFFDGYIARKKKQVTDFGKLIDPIADKLLIGTALIVLAAKGSVDLWVAIVIIARELIVTAIRIYLLPSKIVVPASNFGRAKTVVQSLAIVAVLLEIPFSRYAMLVAVLFTLVSGVEYFVRIRKLTGNKIVNLPNLITLFRFLLIIPFLFYFLNSQLNLALILFAVITLSDKLDGISARLMRQMTEIGSAFDSFTDGIFLSSTLIVLVYAGHLSLNTGVAILVPITIVGMIKAYTIKKYKRIIVSTFSKIAVGFGYLTSFTLMIDFAYKSIFVIVAVALAYLTLLSFIFHFYTIRSENKTSPAS